MGDQCCSCFGGSGLLRLTEQVGWGWGWGRDSAFAAVLGLSPFSRLPNLTLRSRAHPLRTAALARRRAWCVGSGLLLVQGLVQIQPPPVGEVFTPS